MKKIVLIITGLIYSYPAFALSLKQPSKWFSIPVVGITEIKTFPDGIEAEYKGTIAYKNKLAFRKLSFEISCRFDGYADKALLFQFNKERRDSSIDDHHLHEMDKHNRGHGLLFYQDGRMAIVKTSGPQVANVMAMMDGQLDFSSLQKIEIQQKKQNDNMLHVQVTEVNSGKIYTADIPLEPGYHAEGFLGATIYEGRTTVSLRNIFFQGTELITDLNETPRPVYMADFFQKDNRRLVHWRYDEWTTDFDYVRVESPDGKIIDMLKYPKDYWDVPLDYNQQTVVLRTVNIDGHASEPISVELKDNHSSYYEKNTPDRIAIKPNDDVAQFVKASSGEPFIVKGVNYVRLRFGEHANFEGITKHYPAYYDPYDSETLFKILKKYGFNSVRIFIAGRNTFDPGIAGNYETTQGVYKPYMDNFIDFLQRAQKYGIYVYPTLCDGELPLNRYYAEMLLDQIPDDIIKVMKKLSENDSRLYYTKKGINAKKQYLSDFLFYIQKKDPCLLKSFLGLELENELYILANQWPFDMKEGIVEGPDGKSYNMSNDQQRQSLYENGLLYYFKSMVAATKSIDPELLVSQGFYTLRIVDKDPDKHYGVQMKDCPNPGFPPVATLVGQSDVNFLDIHIYHVRKEENVEKGYRLDMETTRFYTPTMQPILKQKPFFLGEFGSFKFMATTFQQAQTDMLLTCDLAIKDKAQGHMIWTFDTFEQRSLWHAMEDESFLKELSLLYRKYLNSKNDLMCNKDDNISY